MAAAAPYFCDAAEHFVGSSASPADPVYAGARGTSGRIDGPRRKARFHGPRALALDGAMLYVADTGNGALRCIDTRAGVVNTAVTLEDICTIAHVHEFTPSGLACDGDVLAVADIRNHVVWAYHLRTYRLDLLAGTPGVHGDQDGRADEARFWLPNAVSTSADGFVVSEARGRRLISRAGDVHTLR
jgi:hypothetical protein